MKNTKWISGTVGTLATIAVWWIVAATMFRNQPKGAAETIGAIPTPPEVLAQFVEDGFGFFARNAAVTLTEASIGFVWGNSGINSIKLNEFACPRSSVDRARAF